MPKRFSSGDGLFVENVTIDNEPWITATTKDQLQGTWDKIIHITSLIDESNRLKRMQNTLTSTKLKLLR